MKPTLHQSQPFPEPMPWCWGDQRCLQLSSQCPFLHLLDVVSEFQPQTLSWPPISSSEWSLREPTKEEEGQRQMEKAVDVL
jgi:hypothetical protein